MVALNDVDLLAWIPWEGVVLMPDELAKEGLERLCGLTSMMMRSASWILRAAFQTGPPRAVLPPLSSPVSRKPPFLLFVDRPSASSS